MKTDRHFDELKSKSEFRERFTLIYLPYLSYLVPMLRDFLSPISEIEVHLNFNRYANLMPEAIQNLMLRNFMDVQFPKGSNHEVTTIEILKGTNWKFDATQFRI